MKKIVSLLVLCFVLVNANAQTSKELIGKWKLVSWKEGGKDKDIKQSLGSDEVYQVFRDGNDFESLVGEKTSHGKWELSDDNKTLKIKSGIITTKFTLETFDENKRVMTSKYGTMEYKKEQ